MDLTARYQAMDEQRFDPMRRKNAPNRSIVWNMGQALRRLSQPELPPNGVVGGIWSDHELVLVPLEVSSYRNSVGSFFADSFSSESVSSTSTSTSATSSAYFTASSPNTAATALDTSPSVAAVSMGSRQMDTYDRDDFVVTRTIIRPATQPSIRGTFARPSSPTAPPRPASPPSRPNTPAFQALNCFRPSAFESEVDDLQTDRGGMVGAQPVLQVIVTQTREQYEQDLAFKEAVRQVYPEAASRRRRAVRL